jgi:F-type H+-transporting ATPase subunit a
MSSAFHHGHSSYEGLRLYKEGTGKAKIIETLPDGSDYFPFDVSITKNIAAMFVSIILLLIIFLSIARRYKANPNRAPKGIQSLLEPVILFIRDEVAKPSIGHKYEKYMPYLLTVFFFIWINNMMGLVPFPPGGANFTGNIAVTFTLAMFTFFITTFSGNKNYWQHMFNTPGVPWWMKMPIPLMPVIEVIGAMLKPMVLMIRLFANISAGHIIALGFLSLIFIFEQSSGSLVAGVMGVPTVMFLIFMTFLELLVAFIQAYVFTFLSAVYFGLAVEEHEHH